MRVFILFAFVLFANQNTVTAQDVTLHALPVSSGNCMLLQCPAKNRTIVVDCGTAVGATGGWKTAKIKDYLRENFDDGSQVSVILTHQDYDHYSHFRAIADVFGDRIEAFWFGGRPADIAGNSRARIATLARHADTVNGRDFEVLEDATSDTILDRMHVLQEDHFSSPDTLACVNADAQSGGLSGTILTANERGDSKNQRSLVFGVTTGRGHLILPGDAEGGTDASMIRNAIEHQIDLGDLALLAVAHHGSASHGSNSRTLGKLLEPEIMLASAGNKIGFGHPKCSAVDNLSSDRLMTLDLDHTYACYEGSNRPAIERTVRKGIFSTWSNGLVVISYSGKEVTVATTAVED